MADLSNAPAFAQNLQPASYAGVPFYYSADGLKTPRKAVIHELPLQNTPIVEDLGAAANTISFRAWVWGDDCAAQATALRNACNKGTQNELIDPVNGSVQAFCTNFEQEFTNREGNIISISLSFVIVAAFQNISSTTSEDTTQDLSDGADELDDSADYDFEEDTSDFTNQYGNFLYGVESAATTVLNGAEYVADAVTSTISDVVGTVTGAINDVVSAANQVAGIGFAFTGTDWTCGRYGFGSLTSAPTALATLDYNQSAPALLEAATTALVTSAQTSRQAVYSAAGTALGAVVAGTSVPTALQATVEALRQANAPQDAIRILATMASYQPTLLAGTDPLSININSATAATAACFRRACLSSIGRAVAAYQPASPADAQSIISTVAPLFDAEAMYASANSDLKSGAAIKRLKGFITNDQNTKASNLTQVQTITLPTSMPLKMIAVYLYGDATRCDQLLQMNPNIIHPAFSPLTIVAPIS